MAEIINVDVDKLYADLREKIASIHSENEIEVIDRAFEVANKCHGEQRRRSGEPYIIHPIAVADILVDLGMDWQSIAAALLHDVVEDTEITLEQIEKHFGKKCDRDRKLYNSNKECKFYYYYGKKGEKNG